MGTKKIVNLCTLTPWCYCTIFTKYFPERPLLPCALELWRHCWPAYFLLGDILASHKHAGILCFPSSRSEPKGALFFFPVCHIQSPSTIPLPQHSNNFILHSKCFQKQSSLGNPVYMTRWEKSGIGRKKRGKYPTFAVPSPDQPPLRFVIDILLFSYKKFGEEKKHRIYTNYHWNTNALPDEMTSFGQGQSNAASHTA